MAGVTDQLIAAEHGYVNIDYAPGRDEEATRKAKWLHAVLAVLTLKPLREAMAGSSVPWVVYVFIMPCAFFLLLYVTERITEYRSVVQDLVLIGLMFAGFVAQVVCLLKKHNVNFVSFNQVGHVHSNTYLMSGVYVFGTGTLLIIVLRLQIYYHAYETVLNCPFEGLRNNPIEPVWPNKSNSSSPYPHIFTGFCQTDLAYDIARLLFTIIQIFFMQTFRAAIFRRSCFVEFTLYHTIVTNACIWVKYVLNETSLLKKHKESTRSYDDIVQKAEGIEETVTPFILEYSLIAAGILQSISSQMQENAKLEKGGRQSDKEAPGKPDARVQAPLDDKRRQIHPADAQGQSAVTGSTNEQVQTAHTDGQDAPAAPSPSEEPTAVVNIPAQSTEPSIRSIVVGSQPGLILGALCGIILVAASFTFKSPESLQSERSHRFFLLYEGILALLQALIVLMILHYLQRHNKFDYETCSDDILLIIGFVGIFAFHCLALVSVANVFGKKCTTQDGTTITITMVHLVSLLICQLLQTLLIILSRRYTRSDADIISIQKSGGKIRQCCLFLLTTNLGFWALDSFVEMNDNAKTSYPCGPLIFGGDWTTITALTYPFVVFYRFHSAAMLYEFWSRFKWKSK